MTESYLNYIVDKYSIDYVVHGDDPCIVDGKDVYEAAKRTGKYRSIPRTEGVSTTDIVGRMLLLANEHHNIPSKPVFAQEPAESLGQHSRFLTTARLLKSFSTGVKPPTDTERIVYMDGAWDLFHCGHAEILKKVKEVRLVASVCAGLSEYEESHIKRFYARGEAISLSGFIVTLSSVRDEDRIFR
jgi:ethanolamine-phosphate cytidylyltransferase